MADGNPAGNVDYSLPAFRRAKFVGGHGKLVLLLTDQDQDLALAALAQTAGDVNEAGRVAEMDDVWFQVGGAVPTPRGPAAPVLECEPARALPRLLQEIARGLAARGLSGELKPATEAVSRVYDNHVFGALGAGFLLPVDPERVVASYSPLHKQPLKHGWMVEPEIAASVVAPLLEWVLATTGPVHVWADATQFLIDPAGVVDYVLATLPHTSQVRVARPTSDTSMRSIDFDWYGYLGVQSYDTAVPRAQHFTALTELLTAASPDLAAGFIRESTTRGGDRTVVLSRRKPPSPLGQALQRGFWLSSHLEADYVYDAYVEQVMTTSQLTKTRDLAPERWLVTDLGHDHHLVAHSHPELWLAEATPAEPGSRGPGYKVAVPDDVLAQARADFGEAIMTIDTVEQFPPPGIPREEQERALSNYELVPR